MTAFCKKLKEEKVDFLGRFRMAYREVYRSRNQEKQKQSKLEDEPVDYDELWDMGAITVAEI